MKIERQGVNTLKLNSTKTTNNSQPIFSFEYLYPGFDLTNLINTNNIEYYKQFLNKINKLTQLTWQTIQSAPRTANGTEIIDRACIKISLDKYSKTITPDENILSFHLSNLFRLIGIRRDSIFYIMFIDINGEVYNHSKNKK